MFAALARNPRLIEPIRAVYAELRHRMARDGLTPGVGETILVAMDGLWLNRLLRLAPFDHGRTNAIRRTPETLLVKGNQGRLAGTALRTPRAGRPAARPGNEARA